MIRELLIIFTRNPELGMVKTRLAAEIGDEAALKIYRFLLRHTFHITREIEVDKRVYYSDRIQTDDVWKNGRFERKLQEGKDLGEKMFRAFLQGFEDGYTHIIIIGSDMYEISQKEIENAFIHLRKKDYVIGPAKDGGYYLMGMNKLNNAVFRNKPWGTANVLRKTMDDLDGEAVHLLPVKNDIDYLDDIRHLPVFYPFYELK